MDRQQEGVLTLIRSAVTGQALALPEDFDLDSSLPLLKRHQLTALACAGALNCGLVPGAQLFEGYGKSLKKSEDQLRILKKLFAAFDENGIAYLPLKGSNMKALYPRPELRVMGDADILIRLEQYAQIVPILESLGFEFQVESDHELIWHAKSLHLELHKRLIPSYNEDYYAYFGDGWRLAKKQAGCRYALSPEDDLIYQFTHFAKHYRDGGIGCRHVTDLWVYKRHFPNLDTAYIRRELDKLQLLAFYDNICRLVGVWFEGAPADQMTDFISEFIFESGSWGKARDHTISAEVRNTQAAGSVFAGWLRSVRLVLFPSLENLSVKYPILKKAPWLLPVFWVVRWFNTLLFRQDAIRARQKKWQIATPAEIETYQQALHYVGLDFRFKK